MESSHVNGEVPRVEDAIKHLYSNKLFTDATVIYNPGSEKFYVHKLILAMYSPVLHDRFYGKRRFGDDLYVEGIGISAVKNMLNYCYGELPVLENLSEIRETKKIAEKYKIDELANICRERISEVAVEVSNVLMVLETAMEYENKVKEKECLELISENQEAVFLSETFGIMRFESVCQIFEKLRQMGSLTEVQYLRSILRWMGCNSDSHKEEVKKEIEISKLSVNEFIDILISFPSFFTNIEISHALNEIKSAHKTEQESMKSLEVSSTKVKCSEIPSNTQERDIAVKKNQLIISIMNEVEDLKRAIVTVKDEIGSRSLQFPIIEDVNQGIFASLSQEIGDHIFDNVDISYEGIYFMMTFAQDCKSELSSTNYIEALKAAVYFQLKNVHEFCKMRIESIIDFDPLFLDGLRYFPFFEDRFIQLLTTKPKRVTLHPNFINCSFELIEKLLEQDELDIPSELQLLIVTVTWLEARNRLRWNFRDSLLSKIAFENIPCSDLDYVIKHYPNFFTDNEINCILLYKKENTNRASLPEWYRFKTRRLVSS